jgi:hypothetical protein
MYNNGIVWSFYVSRSHESIWRVDGRSAYLLRLFVRWPVCSRIGLPPVCHRPFGLRILLVSFVPVDPTHLFLTEPTDPKRRQTFSASLTLTRRMAPVETFLDDWTSMSAHDQGRIRPHLQKSCPHPSSRKGVPSDWSSVADLSNTKSSLATTTLTPSPADRHGMPPHSSPRPDNNGSSGKHALRRADAPMVIDRGVCMWRG